MKIVSIGGGPAGLFFAILLKKARPEVEIDIYERNRPDDTFGWGVVFSDETLGNIAAADPESFAKIEAAFVHWTDIETFYGGVKTVSTGHGFSGLARKELLLILQDRARELGVNMHFETEVKGPEQFPDADLILAADGVNSGIREQFAEHFQPNLDWRQCRFAWFGTDKPMDAFTFVFLPTEWGLFQVHAYPFGGGLGTWIVECQDDVWQRAGFADRSEEESLEFCQELFKDYLDGHRLLANRSMWRVFPTVYNERWHHGNVVLMGDAAHTAHFSIGSGTKLAMEDSIALSDALLRNDDVTAALQDYEDDRRIDVLKLQKTAQTSLEWFENSARYTGNDGFPGTGEKPGQHPARFAFNLMTRSKAITWDNLALRDPRLVQETRDVYAQEEGADKQQNGEWPVPMFVPFKLRDLELPNRVVVSPMCMYSARDGRVNDWHLVHLGSRAVGGAGLVMTEMTNVSAEGRITPGCAGLYQDDHVVAWRRVVDFIHEHSEAAVGIQLAHAGRKGSTHHGWDGKDTPLKKDKWQTLGPSAIPFRKDWPAPKEMDRADMETVRDQFVQSAEMAEECGFDLIELHMAHGYLLSSFLSPLSNKREDDYGGSLSNRMRFPLEVTAAVRDVWPDDKPLAVRLTGSDWAGDEGMTPAEAVEMARALKELGVDIIDVSSGGNVPDIIPVYGRMYQVPFAERIRYEADIPVMAVGAVLGADHANTILAAGRADLVCMARPHLRQPYLTLDAAHEYGHEEQYWPGQYLAGRLPPKG